MQMGIFCIIQFMRHQLYVQNVDDLDALEL